MQTNGLKVTAVFLLMLTSLSACRHVRWTSARFHENVNLRYPMPELISGLPQPMYEPGDRLILEIRREIDRSRRAIDDEETEVLLLELKDYTVGKKMRIPSAEMRPYLAIGRYGSTSYGRVFDGFLVVRSVSDSGVDASLDITVQSSTVHAARRFHTSVFRGEYRFARAEGKQETSP